MISNNAGNPAAIGILGGTFDPVHHGHLRIALDVSQQLGFAEVRLLPSRQPPHRDTPSASPSQRLAMLQRALANEATLCVDQRELQRTGPSYMVDTLASLRAELPTTPLCLLLGTDAYRDLPQWHRWQALFDYAHILVLQRPGRQEVLPEVLQQFVHHRRTEDSKQLHRQLAGCVYSFQATQLNISATRIRQLIQAAQSPRYLLPERVLDYIEQQHLYCADSIR